MTDSVTINLDGLHPDIREAVIRLSTAPLHECEVLVWGTGSRLGDDHCSAQSTVATSDEGERSLLVVTSHITAVAYSALARKHGHNSQPEEEQ